MLDHLLKEILNFEKFEQNIKNYFDKSKDRIQ